MQTTSDGHPTRNGRAFAQRVLSSVERFLAVEAASGIVLLAAALTALIIAASPLRAVAERLWHLSLGVEVGPLLFRRDLHFWINDGLMAIFFFVIGLEIRREVRSGELSRLRRAALPLVAALGGMLAPAAIYLAFGGESRGWAVPVATDIAFAVGVLAVLGKRVSPATRVLLLALAVADDLGAIVVIAAFYTAGIAPAGLLVAAGGVAAILLMQRAGVAAPLAYLPAAVVVWAGALMAGVHPTLAGVVVGLLTPGTPAVERLEARLHGWVAWAIMPLFALANAGVALGGASLRGPGLAVFLGVSLGLALGKPLGILTATALTTRVGLTALPAAVRWRDVLVLGQVAGIGFTMALFIAALAFPPGPLLETAKLAILCGSALSGVAGLVAGRVMLRPAQTAGNPGRNDAG
jgi:NhaA family Na+:H+ antiporter